MALPEEFIRDIESQILNLRQRIASLESGSMHVGETPSLQKGNLNQKSIEQYKKTIADLEKILLAERSKSPSV